MAQSFKRKTQMSKFMICPVSAIEDFNTFEEARAQALKLSESIKESKGFVVYEVRELGRYETMAPLWVENKNDAGWRPQEPYPEDIGDTASMPAPRLRNKSHRHAEADDEIPF